MASNVISTTEFKSLTLKGRGKVRDIYDLGDRLLIVATDRISAFDVVMPNPIPDKGRVLTQLSKFWFELTKDIISNHVISTEVEDFPRECQPYREGLEGRAMLVTKTEPLPVECVVRGYLSGSCNSDTMEVWSRGEERVWRRKVVNRGRPVENPTLKDLTVGHFKVGRYLERRSREGLAIVLRCADFSLSLTTTVGSVLSF
jgi:phosphoribosylaminoimidazole-succinocarboxamide synthase